MNVRIDTLVHSVYFMVEKDAVSGHACTPDLPCKFHQAKLVWHVQTWCGIRLHVKGRPKEKQVTCIACIARAA